jgi:hypothetical protein
MTDISATLFLLGTILLSVVALWAYTLYLRGLQHHRQLERRIRDLETTLQMKAMPARDLRLWLDDISTPSTRK